MASSESAEVVYPHCHCKVDGLSPAAIVEKFQSFKNEPSIFYNFFLTSSISPNLALFYGQLW
jgi:hypothetical protein